MIQVLFIQSPQSFEQGMFLFDSAFGLDINIVIRAGHAGHVPRPPHGPLPGGIQNLLLQVSVIGSQSLVQ